MQMYIAGVRLDDDHYKRLKIISERMGKPEWETMQYLIIDALKYRNGDYNCENDYSGGAE